MAVLISGLAFRGTIAGCGARAITGILLPGDICGLGNLLQMPSHQEVTAIIDCEVAILHSVQLSTMCLDALRSEVGKVAFPLTLESS